MTIKEFAVNAMLQEAGFKFESVRKRIMADFDIENISLKDDANLFIGFVKEKYADFIPRGIMLKEQIMQIKDCSERQKAIAENIDLFM